MQCNVHAPQFVHFDLSTRIPKTAVLLKNEYIAPSGQKNRQNGRNINIDQAIKYIAIDVFRVKRNPRESRRVSLNAARNQPAKIVPSGQKSLQK